VDLNQAIQFGLLVKAAETVLPENTAPAGQTLPATYNSYNVGYKTRSSAFGAPRTFGSGSTISNSLPRGGHFCQAQAKRMMASPQYTTLSALPMPPLGQWTRWQRFNSITGQLVDDLRTQPGRLVSHTACP
jgi:hypothetical protein